MYLKKVIKKQKFEIFFVGGLEGHQWKEQDPDPLVRGTDPRIQIHTKMSRIRIRLPLFHLGALFPWE